ASFVPVFVGTMFAFIENNTFHTALFVAMMLAAILIQAATNMFNEYYDFKRGLDKEDSVGIDGTIVRDGVSHQKILTLAFLLFGIAIILSVYIAASTSCWIADVGAFCLLFWYLNTGGQLTISYTPFVVLFAWLCMLSVMMASSYFIQTLTITIWIIHISLPR